LTGMLITATKHNSSKMHQDVVDGSTSVIQCIPLATIPISLI